MDEDKKYKRAKKRARDKIGFLRHLCIYVIVIAFLAIINRMTWGGYNWWLWPALGWGIGVLSHFLQVYAFGSGSLEERMIQRELDLMDDEDKGN
ncbi:MAG: 2TM domain-containing protein [Spirochaetales bacterium]|nr:2TM domain-containing protein [Spirochaetales bacterium]